MGERSAEVGAIGIGWLFLGRVDILASRAVDLDPGDLQILTDGDGQHVLLLAHHTRTIAKPSRQVSLPHYRQTLRSSDVSRVNQTVELSRMLVHLQKSILVAVYLGSSTSSSAGGTVRSIILRASLDWGWVTRTCWPAFWVRRGWTRSWWSPRWSRRRRSGPRGRRTTGSTPRWCPRWTTIPRSSLNIIIWFEI